jgi:hypothetical protein
VSDLTEELAKSVRKMQAIRQAQLAAERERQESEAAEQARIERELTLSEYGYTADLDEQSDDIYETCRIETVAELESAKFSSSAELELFIRCSPAVREQVLSLMIASLNPPVHLSTPEYPEDHPVEPYVICSRCLSDGLLSLPTTTQARVYALSHSAPMDSVSRAELGADELISQLLERRRATGPKVTEVQAHDGQPTGDVSVDSAPGSTLEKKLFQLMKES